MHCDFCGLEVTKEELLIVPTKVFTIPEIYFKNESWGWGACGTCGTYIRDGDWPGLLDRAIAHHANGENIREVIAIVFNGIRVNQDGPVRGWSDEKDNKEG